MAIEYLVNVHRLSIRRACASVGLARAAWYQAPVDWMVRDRPIIEALLALSEKKPGLGVWKLFGRVWTPPRLQALCSIASRYDWLRVSGLVGDAVSVGIGP